MNKTERDELRRAIVRFQELTQPQKLAALLDEHEKLETFKSKATIAANMGIPFPIKKPEEVKTP